MTFLAALAAAPTPDDPSYDEWLAENDPNGCLGSGNFLTDVLNPGCEGQNSVADAIEGSVVEPWVADMKQGVADGIKTMVTFWIDVPNPNVGNIDDLSKSETITFLQGGLLPVVAWIMCFTVVAGLLTVIWTQRAEPAKVIGQMLLTYIMIDAIGVGAIAVALEITDNASKWLIEQSTEGTSFSDNLFSLFDTTEGIGSSILLLGLLAIAALIAAFTCVLMISRGGILIALTGAMMLGVALSGTKSGLQVMRHYFAWIGAFVVYKLAGAIVYAAGFRLLGTDTGSEGNGFLQILHGLTLLMLAVLALPAVIRLIVPMAAPAAQGRGAGAAAAGVAAASAGALARR